jgi:hypothetical protein
MSMIALTIVTVLPAFAHGSKTAPSAAVAELAPIRNHDMEGIVIGFRLRIMGKLVLVNTIEATSGASPDRWFGGPNRPLPANQLH